MKFLGAREADATATGRWHVDANEGVHLRYQRIVITVRCDNILPWFATRLERYFNAAVTYTPARYDENGVRISANQNVLYIHNHPNNNRMFYHCLNVLKNDGQPLSGKLELLYQYIHPINQRLINPVLAPPTIVSYSQYLDNGIGNHFCEIVGQ